MIIRLCGFPIRSKRLGLIVRIHRNLVRPVRRGGSRTTNGPYSAIACMAFLAAIVLTIKTAPMLQAYLSHL